MKPKQIKYSSAFFKSLKRFPSSELKSLKKQEQIFKEDVFDPRLKTHKLKGKLADFYSFSVSYQWRIVFHFEEGSVVVFDNIGTHAIYNR
ncbi:MAG: type II toxin-antitoxin system mRNA interferase toxin, RelE/StbE family [Candidatus Woykebacteria bacterium]